MHTEIKIDNALNLAPKLNLNRFLKRIMDIIISSVSIITFFPILVLIFIMVKQDSEGPALYIHTRVGRNAKEFDCFKFRTMKTNSNPNKLAESADDDRITEIGKVLRKTSLDELPQIFNVFLGDMSIVGPRPALPVQVKNFSDSEILKIAVKPGITGWTQVNGRNSIPYKKRMELDVWYAENNNIFIDIFIIFKTFKVLLFPDKGIYDVNSTSPVE